MIELALIQLALCAAKQDDGGGASLSHDAGRLLSPACGVFGKDHSIDIGVGLQGAVEVGQAMRFGDGVASSAKHLDAVTVVISEMKDPGGHAQIASRAPEL